MNRNVGLAAIATCVLSTRMIRALGIGSILVIAQAVPAFAEKITLACSYGGDYVTLYYTFDLAAKTVVDHAAIGDYAIRKDTYAIEITTVLDSSSKVQREQWLDG